MIAGNYKDNLTAGNRQLPEEWISRLHFSELCDWKRCS